MSFSRDKTENTHTRAHRLEGWLQSLAKLATLHTQPNPAAHVAQEAVAMLDVRACMLHRLGEAEMELIAQHQQEVLQDDHLEQFAACVAADVAAARKTVNISNLSARYPNELVLNTGGVTTYLGLPLFNPQSAVIGVAAVMGNVTRRFDQEDEWWLRTATLPISNTLAYEALKAKFSDLEHTLAPKTAGVDSGEDQLAASKLSVLVIDDDHAVNDVICDFLGEEGYRVEAAFDGLEGVRKFRPSEHNVVMTDVAMPHMNGWELIAALRVRAPDLPVVLITGYNIGAWNESYLRKQGIVAVLSKPLDLNKLSNVLQSIALPEK